MTPSQKVHRREPVEATPRGPMSKARRLRIYVAHEGRCGVCRVKVPLAGTTMDHALQLWMGGEDDDAQMRPLCPKHLKLKDAADARDRAKVRHVKAFHEGTKPDPIRKLEGRGFEELKTKTRWPSRTFSKRRGAPSRASPAADDEPGISSK